VSEIEDIILSNDRRGISALRSHLPKNFCQEAAQLILENPGPVLICTGFYILAAEAPETDGPPGAYFLGKTLESLGHDVTIVTDIHTSFLFKNLTLSENLVEFPIVEAPESKIFAQVLLNRIKPSLVISIERCSATKDGAYLNMRGADISDYNAKLDYLFEHQATLGIGDGGNEIGMGNLSEHIPSISTLPKDPSVTKVDKLIIASVSNWGSYGLITALSLLSGNNLLPSKQEEEAIIRQLVDLGAVDGISNEKIYAVDGFSLEENGEVLGRLNTLVLKSGI
jgi:hypothetical protein